MSDCVSRFRFRESMILLRGYGRKQFGVEPSHCMPRKLHRNLPLRLVFPGERFKRFGFKREMVYPKEEPKEYIPLEIIASNRLTKIWVADDEGFLITAKQGYVKTSLLPGKIKVRFGLKNIGHEFDLQQPLVIRQE